MDLEDEVLREFEKREAEVLAMRQLAEREREQKEEERRQKEEAMRREEEAIKREAETQRRFARFLAGQGSSVETISQLTGLDEAAVRRLLED
jgi:sRNA-binding protein